MCACVYRTKLVKNRICAPSGACNSINLQQTTECASHSYALSLSFPSLFRYTHMWACLQSPTLYNAYEHNYTPLPKHTTRSIYSTTSSPPHRAIRRCELRRFYAVCAQVCVFLLCANVRLSAERVLRLFVGSCGVCIVVCVQCNGEVNRCTRTRNAPSPSSSSHIWAMLCVHAIDKVIRHRICLTVSVFSLPLGI